MAKPFYTRKQYALLTVDSTEHELYTNNSNTAKEIVQRPAQPDESIPHAMVQGKSV